MQESDGIIVVPMGDNYAYLLPCGAGRCLVIDPGQAAPVLAAVRERGLVPLGVFLTHGHADHAAGVPALRAAFPGLPLCCGPGGRAGTVIPDGGALPLPGAEVRVLHTPGHSADAACLLAGDDLFTGDTLFGAGCGRVFTRDFALMFRSLERLAALPPRTRLWFGHEYTLDNLEFAALVEPGNPALPGYRERVRAAGGCSVPGTLEEELAANPFLRCRERAVRTFAQKKGAAGGDPCAVFAVLRKEKDLF